MLQLLLNEAESKKQTTNKEIAMTPYKEYWSNPRWLRGCACADLFFLFVLLHLVANHHNSLAVFICRFFSFSLIILSLHKFSHLVYPGSNPYPGSHPKKKKDGIDLYAPFVNQTSLSLFLWVGERGRSRYGAAYLAEGEF